MSAHKLELATALSAVRQASILCGRVRAALVEGSTLTKDDHSPVTVADFGAQAVVLHKLQQALPDDPVVAEEDSAALMAKGNTGIRERVLAEVRQSLPGLEAPDILAAIDRGNFEGGPDERFWTLDPIDGTKGFLRNDQYAVALALIEHGEPVMGVLGCPQLPYAGQTGCLLFATRGGGAQIMPMADEKTEAIAVTSTTSPAEACFCESVESGHSKHDWSARVAEKLGITRPSVRMDSQCKYAAIARGDADIYLRLPTRSGYEEKIWDHAAGCLIVQEAGGTVTDITGKPPDFSLGRTLRENRGIVATNGKWHETVIEAVQAAQSM